MRHVVFVAPYLLETTQRFVDAATGVPGVLLSVVSGDPSDRLWPHLRERVTGYWRVEDPLSPDHLTAAVRSLSERFGPVHRLLGPLEHVQVPLAEVRERLGISGMGAEVMKNFRDKARMKDLLRASGLPCARHRLVTDVPQGLAFCAEVGFPVVVKPPEGAGASGTFQVETLEQLEGLLPGLSPSTAHPVLIEEFVRGEEHSFDTVWIRGEPVFWSVNQYAPTPLDVLRHPWIQWCVVLPRELEDGRFDAIREVGMRAVRALGMETGISHMEWFRRADGSPVISEVAARPPGAQFTSLLSYAYHMDFYGAWARVMIDETFEPPQRHDAVGCAYVRGQGRGRVVTVRGIEAAQRELGHLVMEARLPTPGQPHSQGYEGDGWVILRDPSTQAVEAGLRRLLELVTVELG